MPPRERGPHNPPHLRNIITAVSRCGAGPDYPAVAEMHVILDSNSEALPPYRGEPDCHCRPWLLSAWGTARVLRPTLAAEHPVDGCKPCRTAGLACCCLRHSRGCMLRIRCMEGSSACGCHQRAWSRTPRSLCAAAHTLQASGQHVLGSSLAAAPAPPGCTLMCPLFCSGPTRLDLGQADACGMVQRATAASLRALATRGMCASGVQAWGAAGGRHSQGQR